LTSSRGGRSAEAPLVGQAGGVGTTDERVVVASGGSREIGSAIAIRFAEAGATVARLGATTGELVDINGASYLRA
jgi:hypothetical protein